MRRFPCHRHVDFVAVVRALREIDAARIGGRSAVRPAGATALRVAIARPQMVEARALHRPCDIDDEFVVG